MHYRDFSSSICRSIASRACLACEGLRVCLATTCNHSLPPLPHSGALRALEDLSLFNNDIIKVEGLVALASLRCLSLGNNRLADLEGALLELRPLPRLEAVVLSGNPMGVAATARGPAVYRHFTLAFLPRLRYLDHELVTAVQARVAPRPSVCSHP